ncbi:MAG: hypothetical protein ABI724_10150 [Betaproteobacteria bacterium]
MPEVSIAVRVSREYQFMKLAQPVALYRQHPLQTSRTVEVRERQSEYREHTLRRFGMTGPDGSRVDMEAVRERQFSHAALHCARGDPSVAVSSLHKARSLRPLAPRAWPLYVEAWGKRLTGGSLQRAIERRDGENR